MNILQKLNRRKQRKKMNIIEQQQKIEQHKTDNQITQVVQFPNSEMMARRIKANLAKKAQGEFALVMKELNDSNQAVDQHKNESQIAIQEKS